MTLTSKQKSSIPEGTDDNHKYCIFSMEFSIGLSACLIRKEEEIKLFFLPDTANGASWLAMGKPTSAVRWSCDPVLPSEASLKSENIIRFL